MWLESAHLQSFYLLKTFPRPRPRVGSAQTRQARQGKRAFPAEPSRVAIPAYPAPPPSTRIDAPPGQGPRDDKCIFVIIIIIDAPPRQLTARRLLPTTHPGPDPPPSRPPAPGCGPATRAPPLSSPSTPSATRPRHPALARQLLLSAKPVRTGRQEDRLTGARDTK